MAAWLADNSFSWSKLKKSITAVRECNARHAGDPVAPQWDTGPLGEEWGVGGDGGGGRGGGGGEEEEGAPTAPHLTGSAAEFITSTCYRQQSLKRGAHALEPSRESAQAASTSPSLLHSAPGAYSFSHSTHTHTHTHMVHKANNGHLLDHAYGCCVG